MNLLFAKCISVRKPVFQNCTSFVWMILDKTDNIFFFGFKVNNYNKNNLVTASTAQIVPYSLTWSSKQGHVLSVRVHHPNFAQYFFWEV